MKKLFFFLIFNFSLFTFNLSSLVSPVFAQLLPKAKVRDLGEIEGLGPLGLIINQLKKGFVDVTPASNKLTLVLSAVIGLITIVAGIWFFIKILLAGFSYISSGGDKNKIQESQHTIINSLIGIVIVVGAYALTSLLGKILGLDILNLGGILIKISP